MVDDSNIYVYTDGGCNNNGKKNARAGMGIYFGENDPRNVSEEIIIMERKQITLQN